MYVLGFLFTWLYVRNECRKGRCPFSEKQLDKALSWLVIGLVIGARLGYALFYNPAILLHPIELLSIWKGGLSFHGGLFGGLVAAWLFCKKHKLVFLRFTDVFVIPVAISQAFGRIGNFINGELWGRVTQVPWGMIFPGAGPETRHPSQLYEAAYNLIIGGALLGMRKFLSKPGFLTGMWFVLYSIARFSVEFFREPQVMLGPLTMGQILCIPLLVLGIVLIWHAQVHHRHA